MPNSMEGIVDWRSILEERTTEQTKLATKPDKNSSDKFRPGDKVILRKNLDREGQCLRNKRHINHFKATTNPHRDDEARPDPPHMRSN